MRRKPSDWKQHAAAVAASREAARKLVIGQEPSPGEWQRVPDYARPALEALRPERSRYQSSRLSAPPKPDDPRRWLNRLGMRRVPTTPVELKDYEACLTIAPRSVFTEASLDAAVRNFEFFPSPAALAEFLTNWRKGHPPPKRSAKERRHQRNLLLTDKDRQQLLTAQVGTPIPGSSGQRLTQLHVQAAHTLASFNDICLLILSQALVMQMMDTNAVAFFAKLALVASALRSGRLSHELLARVAGTSVRTVCRALPALRALGLLHEEWRGSVRTEKPRHIKGFGQVMAAHAAATRIPVKTLHRWEGDLRASVDKPRKELWRPTRARRKRDDGC